MGCGCGGHAGTGLQVGEQKHGHPRTRAKGAHLDILLLKRAMKDSVLRDPTSFFQCVLIEYLSCAGHCAPSREPGWLRPPTSNHSETRRKNLFWQIPCVRGWAGGHQVNRARAGQKQRCGGPTPGELSPGEWFIRGGSGQCVHPDATAGGGVTNQGLHPHPQLVPYLCMLLPLCCSPPLSHRAPATSPLLP